jgi:hypothetical protein
MEPASSELISRSSFSRSASLEADAASRILALLREGLRAGTRVGSNGTVVEGVMEKDAVGIEGGIGDGRGDRPESEISVLEDSALGDVVTAFQPKKELILFPGVLGCFESKELADAVRPLDSMCNGGGRLDDRRNAIVWARLWPGGELSTGMNGSLTRRLCNGVPFEN